MIKTLSIAILISLAWLIGGALRDWLKHDSLSQHNAITHYSVESDFEEFSQDFMMVDWDIINRPDLHLRKRRNYIIGNLFIIDNVAYKLDLVDFIKAKKFVSDYVERSY